jgi:hypothetical protein
MIKQPHKHFFKKWTYVYAFVIFILIVIIISLYFFTQYFK